MAATVSLPLQYYLTVWHKSFLKIAFGGSLVPLVLLYVKKGLASHIATKVCTSSNTVVVFFAIQKEKLRKNVGDLRDIRK